MATDEYTPERPALFDAIYTPERYPEIEAWSGLGLVSEVRVPAGHVGWLVLKDEQLEFLSTGGPLGDHATAPRILMELTRLRADKVASQVAFDYVLLDRPHSEPELTDLAEFRAIWDEENKES